MDDMYRKQKEEYGEHFEAVEANEARSETRKLCGNGEEEHGDRTRT